jgi:hypothetical protein
MQAGELRKIDSRQAPIEAVARNAVDSQGGGNIVMKMVMRT